MPIYEYVCNSCSHQLEAIQKISEEPLVNCPACETDSLRKKISAPGFRLKGSGWYETDFKSGNKKNVAGSESGADSTGSSDTDSGSSKSSSDGASTSSDSSGSSSGSGGSSSDSSGSTKSSGD